MATTKNILYIGPYRQNDGWGLAAKGYLLSLLTTPHNIYCVPFYTNPISSCEVSEKQILQAENRRLQEYDIIIQKALPMALCPNKYAKNIGLIVLENNLLYSNGILNLLAMDEIWVPSKKETRCIANSGITTKTNAIMQAIPTEDIANALKQRLMLSFNNKMVDKSYKFYFIGEYIQRKNINDIIVAFHTEFDLDEPVSLIIKTSVPGLNAQQSLQKIKTDIKQLKTNLRIRNNFKEEIIITDKLSQEQLFSIHMSCDCFVSVSYGEAFCRPAAEAVCFGKPVILTSGIGVAEMINKEDKMEVSTQEQPVIVNNPSYVGGLDMYNAKETWSIPSILDLRKQMRIAFENKPKINNNSYYLHKFSYENIGNTLCQLLQ